MIKYTAIGQGNMNSYKYPFQLSQQIPCLSLCNLASNNPTTFSWNDGTPTKKATASPTGVATQY